MEVRHASRVSVGETMMPENTLLITGEMFNNIFSRWGVEHQIGEGRRGDRSRSNGIGRRLGTGASTAKRRLQIGRRGRNTISAPMRALEEDISLIPKAME
jgi:hypothetical protein